MTERVSDETIDSMIRYEPFETEQDSAVWLDLRDARSTIATLRQQLAESADALHYANGVADLAVKHRDLAEAALADAKTAAWIDGRNAAAAEAEAETEQNYVLWSGGRGSWTSGLRCKWADGPSLAAAIRALQPPSPSPTAEPGSEVRV